AGSDCVSCHMPKIEQTIADVNVRSHTFNFITPEMTDQYKIPNACTTYHSDKTTSWARAAMKEWSGISPWRVNWKICVSHPPLAMLAFRRVRSLSSVRYRQHGLRASCPTPIPDNV